MEQIPLSEVDEKDYSQKLGRVNMLEGFWMYEIPRKHSWAFWEQTRLGYVDVTVMYFYSADPFPTRVFLGIKDNALYAAAAVPSEGCMPLLTYTMGELIGFSDDEYGISDKHRIETSNPQGMLYQVRDLPAETTLGEVIELLS